MVKLVNTSSPVDGFIVAAILLAFKFVDGVGVLNVKPGSNGTGIGFVGGL